MWSCPFYMAGKRQSQKSSPRPIHPSVVASLGLSGTSSLLRDLSFHHTCVLLSPPEYAAGAPPSALSSCLEYAAAAPHLPSPPVLLVSVPHISPLQSPSQKAESHRDFSLSVNPYLLLTIKHSESCFPISFKSPPRLHCHTSEPHSSNTHHHSSLLAAVPKPSILL